MHGSTASIFACPASASRGRRWRCFSTSHNAEASAPPANRVGFGHIAFAVDDVAGTRDAVLAAGGSQVGTIESVAIEGAGTITWTYVRDPEGNIIELQRRDPDGG